MRPARLLLGWLGDDEVARLLASRVAARPDDRARLADGVVRARAAVAARAPGDDDRAAIRDAPAHLAARLGDAAPGARVALVALRVLRAMQPYVFTDRTDVPGRDATLDELADLTLPATSGEEPAVHHVDGTSVLRVTSQSQHLAVLGEFAGPLPGMPPGLVGVGFLVGVAPSMVRVRVVDGRAVLVDGHHRAAALLAAGVEVAPAIVEPAATLYDAWSEGMVAVATCLGPGAPRVGDYLDDEVAATVSLRHVGRQVVVTAEAKDLTADDVVAWG